MTATQRQKILNYLEENGSITVREAFTTLSINSPTKRLSELYKKNMIRKRSISYIAEDGRTNHYTVYELSDSYKENCRSYGHQLRQ